MSSEMEDVRSRLLKVLRLAQQGVGGERENAEALLAKLLRKHAMTMADLEGADQPRAQVWLAAGDAEEQVVFSQLSAKLFGLERKLWTRSGESRVGIELTPSEHAALVIAWEVYRAAFNEARRALVLGFCYKHDLFAPTGAGAAPMSPDEQARAARALAMADTLPGVERPVRRVGAGDDAP